MFARKEMDSRLRCSVPDFSPEEIEHILHSTPHLKDLFDIAEIYAGDEEKVRLAKARRRYQKIMEDMKAAGSNDR